LSLPSNPPDQTGQLQQKVDLEKVKSFLITTLTKTVEIHPDQLEQQRKTIYKNLAQIYAKTGLSLTKDEQEKLFREVADEIIGFGPIQSLLDDPEISEVMVNGYNQVYIELNGKLIKTNVVFQDHNHVLRLIDRIVAPLGRRIDFDHPTVDARLPDGSRVNAIIPPVAIDGPTITIRKFGKDRLGMNQMISLGAITESMALFLKACVVARLNLLISGGTGSGKTTLLNILSSYIPTDERIVTIEDAAELRLQQEHVVRLETKPSKPDGSGAVTIRDLVRNSLRMRPDRIVVGEVRGGEALDMLQAMNTGHDGSLTTLHANTPRDAISRLETMVLMAGLDLPVRIVREQIASAVDLIVQTTRLRDGTRKLTQVTEVGGMEGETVVLTDIFKYDSTGMDSDGKLLGELKPTGIRPLFSQKLEQAGFKLKPEVYGINMNDILTQGRRANRPR